MTKSQIVDLIARRVPALPRRDVEAAVNVVFERMLDAIKRAERIELRGFGCFSVKVQAEHVARNPKTGQAVQIPRRLKLSFLAGKELRDRLNRAPGAAPVPHEQV